MNTTFTRNLVKCFHTQVKLQQGGSRFQSTSQSSTIQMISNDHPCGLMKCYPDAHIMHYLTHMKGDKWLKSQKEIAYESMKSCKKFRPLTRIIWPHAATFQDLSTDPGSRLLYLKYVLTPRCFHPTWCHTMKLHTHKSQETGITPPKINI